MDARRTCSSCGTEVNPENIFCIECGAPFANQNGAVSSPSKFAQDGEAAFECRQCRTRFLTDPTNAETQCPRCACVHIFATCKKCPRTATLAKESVASQELFTCMKCGETQPLSENLSTAGIPVKRNFTYRADVEVLKRLKDKFDLRVNALLTKAIRDDEEVYNFIPFFSPAVVKLTNETEPEKLIGIFLAELYDRLVLIRVGNNKYENVNPVLSQIRIDEISDIEIHIDSSVVKLIIFPQEKTFFGEQNELEKFVLGPLDTLYMPRKNFDAGFGIALTGIVKRIKVLSHDSVEKSRDSSIISENFSKSPGADVASQLGSLVEMFAKGLLSEDEFQKAKKKLLE